MKTDHVQLVLSRQPFFSDLDPSLIELIASCVQAQEFESGQWVFLEGEPCLGLYIVEQGWLRAVKSNPGGREQVIRYVGPGDTFNEIGVLAGGVNLISVEALEPVRLVIIPRFALLELLGQHPALSKAIIERLSNRILHAMNMIVRLSLHSVESRLARFLLDQATGDSVNRQKWATQAEIAAYLGTVPVVINRAFRSFVEDGLIDLERERIRILNRSELEKIASPVE